MKKQIRILTIGAALLATQPIFAMEGEGLKEEGESHRASSQPLAIENEDSKEELLKELASLKSKKSRN